MYDSVMKTHLVLFVARTGAFSRDRDAERWQRRFLFRDEAEVNVWTERRTHDRCDPAAFASQDHDGC
jgi:hypothetical protein